MCQNSNRHHTILGGGIAGISAGYHLALNGSEHIIYEKNGDWGGLCNNFIIDEKYRFDYFIHLSFTKSQYVKDLFSASSNYYSHKPNPTNYYFGHWLKHPAQFSLYPLSAQEKVKIISDFIQKKTGRRNKDYRDWLRLQFGDYFSANFPERYTKKYWTTKPENLSTDWLGARFNIPSLEDILRGAFEDHNENYYYAKEMRYPKKGGYKQFLSGMVEKTNLNLNKEIVLINPKYSIIEFSDGKKVHYDQLISSIPLPTMIKMIKDAPKNVVEASMALAWTSGQLVSFGFNNPDIPKNLWFYIYDEDIYPSRAYSPSLKSPDNVPKGKSSLQYETYYSKYLPKKLSGGALIEHIIKKSGIMDVFRKDDVEVVDYREVPYANVIFDFNRKKAVTIVHRYLDDIGIKYIGRFGEWDYLWSDQSLLSGKPPVPT